MTWKQVIFVSSLAAAASAAGAQIEIPDWDNSVEFELVVSQEPVRPGDSFEVALVADIVKGYHLYGPEEMEPMRTELSVDGDHLTAGKASYPPVIKRELEGLGTYDLYEGTIAIRVPVELEASGSGDAYTLKATVNYQVCTDFACSAPTSDELTLAVSGDVAGAPVEKLHTEIFSKK